MGVSLWDVFRAPSTEKNPAVRGRQTTGDQNEPEENVERSNPCWAKHRKAFWFDVIVIECRLRFSSRDEQEVDEPDEESGTRAVSEQHGGI